MAFDASSVINWLIAAVGTTSAVSIVIFLLGLYVVTQVAKKYIIQAMLFLEVWVPAVVMLMVTDFSTVPSQIIKPEGVNNVFIAILFPYVWDMCFALEGLTVVSGIMIILSYISFVHFGMMFCHVRQVNKLWSFVIGYAFLLGLGLGMINFHTGLINGYIAGCLAVSLPPLFLPMIVLVPTLLIIFYWYGMRKKR